jgi:hypothetical protein
MPWNAEHNCPPLPHIGACVCNLHTTAHPPTCRAGAWLLCVLLLQFQPVVWTAANFKVPLSPLFPSLAVLANIFLISSLGSAAYIRFAIWFVLSLAVYVVYGVHNTADASAEVEMANKSVHDEHRVLAPGADNLSPSEILSGNGRDVGGSELLELPAGRGAIKQPGFSTSLSMGMGNAASPRTREGTPREGDPSRLAGGPALDQLDLSEM